MFFGTCRICAPYNSLYKMEEEQHQSQPKSVNRILPERTRHKPSGALSMNELYNLYVLIKQRLSEQEVKCLFDYQLQRLLLELAQVRFQEISTLTEEQRAVHILSEIKTDSTYWVKDSTVWMRILGKTQEYCQKSREVIHAYEKDLQQLKSLSSKIKMCQPVPYEVQRKVCIPQNYIFFTAFDSERTSQRISFFIIIELKKYLISIHASEEKKVQFFLLEFLLCNEKRKKRKKTEDQQAENSLVWNAFLQYFGKDRFQSISFDYQSEQRAITNLIYCYQLSSIIKPVKVDQRKYEALRDSISTQLWSQQQREIVASGWLEKYNKQALSKNFEAVQVLNKLQPKQGIPGCLNSMEQIEEIHKLWVNLQQDPNFQALSGYKFHHDKRQQVSEQEYKRFLEGLLFYYGHTVNNGKIAEYIRSGYPPAYVKNIKNIYTKNMRHRIANGQCGGGAYGDFISKKDFIQRDLENFNVRWFTKTKPSKKRKKLSDSDEVQSSWEHRN